MAKRQVGIVEALKAAIRQAERSGTTRYRIAKRAGLQQSQIDRIAYGQSVPTLGMAERVAKAIGFRLALVPILAK